jgi:hypothetical protein
MSRSVPAYKISIRCPTERAAARTSLVWLFAGTESLGFTRTPMIATLGEISRRTRLRQRRLDRRPGRRDSRNDRLWNENGRWGRSLYTSSLRRGRQQYARALTKRPPTEVAYFDSSLGKRTLPSKVLPAKKSFRIDEN